MILVVELSARKDSLHFFEFVKPVLDILETAAAAYTVKHYLDITAKDIEDAERFILCGTGLQDHAALKETKRFAWLKKTKKPVLGICAGMQLIGKVHGGRIIVKPRIGVVKVQFLDPDPLMRMMSRFDVYELHNKAVTVPPGFKELAETDIPMAFKKNDAPIYGVLWHPEVLNKELVRAFAVM